MALILDGTNGLSDVDGSAGTPAIRGSDANTGIFFPGADRIGFAEGGVQVGEFDASGNFRFNSGYGSVATAYGCRAWVNFNGTGTVAIRASGNVTSITDNGTGLYTINFTTAMPDTNYAPVLCIRRNNGSTGENNTNAGATVRGSGTYATVFTTSSLQILSGTVTNEGLNDFDFYSVAIFR